MKIKLRYAWFLFIDNYGKEQFSYRELFIEMNELNKINKSDAFKKSLVTTLGTDFVKDFLQTSINFTLGKLFKSFGKGGKIFGNVASIYSEGVAGAMSELAVLSANYVLYRFSREQLYQKPQTVNENAYSLLKK